MNKKKQNVRTELKPEKECLVIDLKDGYYCTRKEKR